KVLHINPAGSVTRVHLHAPEFDLEIHVDVSPSRYAELCLEAGDLVCVSLRRFRIFVPGYIVDSRQYDALPLLPIASSVASTGQFERRPVTSVIALPRQP